MKRADKRADKRQYHCIYKITRFDGKFYIGMHSTDNIDDDYFGSGRYIKSSISKYGIDKHKKEILEILPSRKELKVREAEIVNNEMLLDNLCMNLKTGGEGGFDHAVVTATLLKKYGADYFKNIASKGRSKLTEERKEKIRLAALANNSGKNNLGLTRIKVTCPHCDKSGARNTMSRFHFDKCKYNASLVQRTE